MTIRVAHVVRQYHPSIGGMEEVVRNIAASQLEKTGQEARVITLNRLFRNGNDTLPQEEMVDGVPVVRLPYMGSSRYPLCPQVLGEIKKADLVHVHGVDFFYDFLALTKPIHRRPLMLSTHGGFFHTEFASRLKETWFKTITRASSTAYEKVIATSENDGAKFGEIIRPARLEVIENGVNTIKYSNCGSAKLNRTLIYFGRWSSNKGLIEALDVMGHLVAADPEWRLIITGREYDFTAAELEAEVTARKLNDQVRLEPGPSDERLRSLISEASYFLCLSRHEGFGLAAIEAMSAGLTPVLSDIPPFRKLIDESGLGVMAPADQTEAFANRIEALHALGNDAHVERRKKAMAFAEGYSWTRIAERYSNVYEQLGGRS
ncbi:glycosyltransferase family 4 protein [Marinobacter sp. 1Y8]